MTLILARASAEFVLQVTDRLVTYKQSKQPADRVANKNVLYHASNAMVAIAYTGDAVLRGTPTDQWIVEMMEGIEINQEAPPAMMCTGTRPWRDIGHVLLILRDKLNALDQTVGLHLLIAVQGWQWDSRGRLRPLLGTIEKTPPENTFRVRYEPRDWHIAGAAQIISSPRANLSASELKNLSDRLRYKSALTDANCPPGMSASLLLPRPHH